MKSLIKKLILPISFFMLSLNSNSQTIVKDNYSIKQNQEVEKFLNSLPAKFKNYRSKPATLLEDTFRYVPSSDEFFLKRVYDIDNDFVADAIEFFPINFNSSNELEVSKNPEWYIFFIGEDRTATLIDKKRDGINGNEILYEFNDEKYLKL